MSTRSFRPVCICMKPDDPEKNENIVLWKITRDVSSWNQMIGRASQRVGLNICSINNTARALQPPNKVNWGPCSFVWGWVRSYLRLSYTKSILSVYTAFRSISVLHWKQSTLSLMGPVSEQTLRMLLPHPCRPSSDEEWISKSRSPYQLRKFPPRIRILTSIVFAIKSLSPLRKSHYVIGEQNAHPLRSVKFEKFNLNDARTNFPA